MKRAELLSRAAVTAAFVLLSAGISTAQQASPLRFEVAAIKPGTPRPGYESRMSSSGPGGQFQITNTPLRRWVEMGLSVPDYALKAPSWLDTARFDLNAKLPAGPVDQKAHPAPVDRNPLAEMMKALLIERFGLKWHEESGTVSGYELVTDKKVLAQPASLLDRLKGNGRSSGPTLIDGTNMPMSEFAEMLGKALQKPVVDATHLNGGFNIKLRWRPTDEDELARRRQYGKQYGEDVDNLPDSVFTAVREQLGLRLQSAKVPSKVIVVDHINPKPTEN